MTALLRASWALGTYAGWAMAMSPFSGALLEAARLEAHAHLAAGVEQLERIAGDALRHGGIEGRQVSRLGIAGWRAGHAGGRQGLEAQAGGVSLKRAGNIVAAGKTLDATTAGQHEVAAGRQHEIGFAGPGAGRHRHAFDFDGAPVRVEQRRRRRSRGWLRAAGEYRREKPCRPAVHDTDRAFSAT